MAERVRAGHAGAEGRIPSRTSGRSVFREVVLLAAFLIGFVLLLVHDDWLWRWDALMYDAALKRSSRPPNDAIVIVAIDEYSLDKLGRWPWPRRVHAQLIERLTVESPRVIGLDVILAEEDPADPAGDRSLARALAQNGRTVLPILVERPRLGGPLVETLPLPPFASSAGGLGHIHVPMDPDAIARRVFLEEGLGETRWPSFPVAMLRIAQPGRWEALPGLRRPRPRTSDAASRIWSRDSEVLIPFAGPPGHFTRIPYWDVLEGEYPERLFRDKLVVVGATAAGLSDWLPTPVSGSRQPMPGAELNANVLDALLAGVVIQPAADRWRYIINALLVLTVVLVYPFLTPRSGLLAAGGLVLASLGLSTGLLLGAHMWLPLAPAILAIVISYPLWSWRRLEYAMRFLRGESKSLRRERGQFQGARLLPVGESLRFAAAILPMRGWVVRDADAVRSSWGDPPERPATPPVRGVWSHHDNQSWATVCDEGRFWQLGITWETFDPGDPGDPGDVARGTLLDQIVHLYRADSPGSPRGALEVVQAQIEQLQEAARVLRATRDTVDKSLAQMTDGVVVANSLGHVVLANAKAEHHFGGPAPLGLVGRSLIDLGDRVETRNGTQWRHAVRDVLVNRAPVQLNGLHSDGTVLLISLAPLTDEREQMAGLIVNTSDITSLKESERRRAETLGFLSHDLRSPLISVLALLELARRKGRESNPAEMLARVKAHAERALRLTDEFLALAQAENNEELTREAVNLTAVATRAMEQAHAQAQSRQIALQQQFAVPEAWTAGDPDLLERAVVNLLTNALKYGPAQSTVKVRVGRGNGEVYCCVSDEGGGIAQADIPKIFNRFERVHQKSASPQSGLGLGLAFVKAVVERHGGRVEVTSAPGTGSQFCLHLPESDGASRS